MRILIISDTHGQQKYLEQILDRIGKIDALIHCGDVEGQEDYITALCGCPVYIVAGNNDYFSMLDREIEFDLGPYHIFLTHGHYYGVSINNEGILDEGQSRNADIVMFGHTHKPCLERYKGVTLLNPGSLSYPRQQGKKPSFMLMEIDDAGEIHYTLNYLEKSGKMVQK